jgi:hypothetical protein
MSGEPDKQEKIISAENTFTDPLHLDADESATLSLRNTWVGTAVLQYQLPSMAAADDWEDVPDEDGNVGFTGNTLQTFVAGERVALRAGFKTGGYTSGNLTAHLGKG